MNDRIHEVLMKKIRSEAIDYKKTFPSLRSSEHHLNKYPYHNWIKSRGGVFDWVCNNAFALYKSKLFIHDDLTVSYDGEIRFLRYEEDVLPVQFRKVKSFHINVSSLKSLIGVPYECELIDVTHSLVNSFEGISKYVNIVDLQKNKIIGFKGMSEIIGKVKELNLTGNPIESWDGFTECDTLHFWSNELNESKSILHKAPQNINKILHTGDISKIWIKDFLEEKEVNMQKLRNIQRKRNKIFNK